MTLQEGIAEQQRAEAEIAEVIALIHEQMRGGSK